MDYKEKYEEALERAKAGKPMDEVFPELKESEDERIRKGLIAFVDKYYGEETKKPVLAWLEKHKEQQSAEWSEEDDAFRDLLICILKTEHPNGIFSMSAKHISVLKCDVMPVNRIIDWLKSLRPQPQRRNTYYDIIHGILNTLKDIDFMKITPEHRVSLLNDIRVKCKNADECAAILDEPHWKPSEEQLSALSDVLEESKGNRLAVLKDLYKHIKEA